MRQIVAPEEPRAGPGEQTFRAFRMVTFYGQNFEDSLIAHVRPGWR